MLRHTFKLLIWTSVIVSAIATASASVTSIFAIYQPKTPKALLQK